MSLEEELDIVLEKGVDQTAEDMLERIEAAYGEVPYIFSFMKDQTELLVTKILHNNAILRSSRFLDPKTIELISIAVAASIRCNHCLELHLRIAKRMEISDEEITAALLVASNMANASVLAMATRELSKIKTPCSDDDEDTCEVCQMSNGKPVNV